MKLWTWALMLAFGGLTAFGQVSTTMIAATAMLRDEAQRTRALLATSGVDGRTWFTARVAAALAVMMLVYAAMPLGILAGVIGTNGDVAGAGVSAVRAYGMVTLPTMLIVTLLLSCAAAITRRVLGVLAVALALVGLWQLSLALVNPTAGGMVRTLGALLDPFGNAPVLHMTAQWTVQERSTVAVPLDGVLLLNRDTEPPGWRRVPRAETTTRPMPPCTGDCRGSAAPEPPYGSSPPRGCSATGVGVSCRRSPQ